MRPFWLLLGLVWFLVPALGTAQQERVCNFTNEGRTSQVDRGGVPIIILHDRFEVVCTDGAVLRADSGTLNRGRRELTLVGNVFFEDPDQTLTAQQATYLSALGRLHATGDVVFTNRLEGSTISGPELEYFRATRERPQAQVNARQRPHLTLRPKEQREDTEPLELDADRVTIIGQDDLTAYGDVVIHRSDLDATAGEARYNADTEFLELRRDAHVVSDRFTLSGQIIQAEMTDGALHRVDARTDADLQGENLTVTAPELRIFFRDDRLQRAVARGLDGEESGGTTERPVALARNFRLEADSLDALIPDQRIDQVIAIGSARGEAMDTLRADSAARAAPLPSGEGSRRQPPSDTAMVSDRDLVNHDWIVGDTLIGYFAPADSAPAVQEVDAPADTSAVLQRIVAKGAAQALYRVQRENARPDARRGINYVAGVEIELDFDEQGQVQTARVSGLRQGLYLDPPPDTAGDTATSPPATGGGGPPQQEGEL